MHANNPVRRPPIAVVGVSALFPGSLGAAPFWRNIVEGVDLITDVPESHWRIDDYYDPDPSAPDKTYAKRGGFLPPVPFDPLAFGIPPATLSATDTAQLLALIVAKQVLEDASRGQFRDVDRRRISVILGVASATELVVELGSRIQRPVWTNAMRAAGLSESQIRDVCDRIANHYVPWQEASFPGLLGNVVAGRIANRLDLGGTNVVTDAACASSFAALEMGLNELYLGQSDLVISGGVDAINDIFMYMCFSKTPALSQSGDCRPFSEKADGTLLGEGLGMFALRRLEDAERDGNRIYAVIRGLGASSDGRATSIYGPRPDGQALALSRAYEAAGYSPATVGLVEAHGTGTKAGDLAEMTALNRVFGEADSVARGWCAVGSVKSQIGHTKAAAGAAGMFKAVMALHHKVLPPTIKVERPAATLASGEGPFYVNTRARPWIAGAHPRRASVSSFGFGGSNFHVTLEEYVGESVADRAPTHAAALFLLSAGSREALAESVRVLRARVLAPTYFTEARASQSAFDPIAPARLACVASSLTDLQTKLDSVASSLRDTTRTPNVAGVHVAFGTHDSGRLAFVFSGQGSQYVGMGADLAMEFSAARAVWDRARRTNSESGLDRVAFPPPAFDSDALRKQEDALRHDAQPAIAVAVLAQLALLDAVGLQPDCVAGHSFGEVMALHAAGAFDADAALGIAATRGTVMHAAAGATEGAMSAVNTGRERVEEELHSGGFDVVIANDNGPDQVVISGSVAAVSDAEAHLSARGLRTTRLPVASAFHSMIVSAASEPFAAYLATQSIAPPRMPVYGTASATPYPAEAASVRAILAAQLAMPVRFREQIEAMYAAGVRTFVEIGPGSVLTGLVERIVGTRPANVLALDRKGRRGLEAFWEALGRLALLGKSIDFAPLWAGIRAEEPALPDSPGVVAITGANFGKPYPAKIERVPPRPDVPAAAMMAPAPAPVAAAPMAAAGADRLALFAAFQEQVAESQKAFESALADSHRAFLETTQKALEAMTGGASMPHTQPTAPPVRQSMPAAPAAPRVVAPVAAAAVPAARPAPVPTPTAIDPAALLLSVVADKTGYPVEMLNPAMTLEGDLGVDSIKQVEILAALRERAPNLPEVEANDLARLRTLGAIIEFLATSATPVASGAPAAPSRSVTPAIDMQATVLAVVAEKTGYPAEMLNESMTLEGDLGIDSIKQVEILAALRERAPAMRDLEAADLTRLRTLGAIIAHLRGTGAPTTTPTVTATQTVDRFAVGLADTPARKTALTLPRTIAIVPDRKGVAVALAGMLRARGAEVQLADAVSGTPDAVLHLAGLDAVPSERLVQFHRDALAAAKAVAPTFAREGGLFVTVQNTGGTFALEGAAGSTLGLTGLVKCAAAEWPRATCKAIDFATDSHTPSQVATALLSEILEAQHDSEVALRDGIRRIVAHVPAPAAESTLPLDSQSVVVVTGGGKGVTAASTIALARAVGCRIAILGRTPLSGAPGDEIAATLASMEGAGSRVRYLAVDVRDADAVARAMADIRREWGPISGLVHGAGVIADSRIVNKTSAQFDSVFGTKVIGLQSLLAALRDDPLKVLCVFSSVASRSGNVGQSDYAMANAVATQMVHAEARRRGGDCLVKSIHWGPWEGGMVTPALAARFRSAGVPLIPLAAGADYFVREIGLPTPVEVLAGGPLPTAGRPASATATAAE